jgi:corrinoid protein of di/trimethylamine methyltransferase
MDIDNHKRKNMASEKEFLEDIKQTIIDGDDQTAVQTTHKALEAGLDPQYILSQGLMAGANIVGERFETGELFLPELMLTGRALKSAMTLLEPALQAKYSDDPNSNIDTGVVVIATVQTDIHDIGKNIVSSMLMAAGFQVQDMGVDVPIKSIIDKAQEVNANIIASSALLTTSMPVIRDLIRLLDAMGERDRFKVMVGGASITPEFAKQIGADGTAPNAIQAIQVAKRLVIEQRQEKEPS